MFAVKSFTIFLQNLIDSLVYLKVISFYIV